MSKETYENLSQSEMFLSEIKLSGGVSHYVFKLVLEDRTKLYLKKRADHFAQLSQMRSNPKNIRYKYLILTPFQQLAPNNFPEVLTFSEGDNYIVLTNYNFK